MTPIGSSKWDTNIQSMNNEYAAMHLVMHSYEPHMVIADDKRNIRYERQVMFSGQGQGLLLGKGI